MPLARAEAALRLSRERANLSLTTMAQRRLEENVVAWVASGELALVSLAQVVVNIIGLPVAVGEVEVVNERAINNDSFVASAGVDGVCWHKRSADLEDSVSRKD